MSNIRSIMTEYRKTLLEVYDLDKDGDIPIYIYAEDGTITNVYLSPLEAGELIEILKEKLGENE